MISPDHKGTPRPWTAACNDADGVSPHPVPEARFPTHPRAPAAGARAHTHKFQSPTGLCLSCGALLATGSWQAAFRYYPQMSLKLPAQDLNLKHDPHCGLVDGDSTSVS
jgi:hypothetical protein